jgi:hypothetical protein
MDVVRVLSPYCLVQAEILQWTDPLSSRNVIERVTIDRAYPQQLKEKVKIVICT